MSTEDQSRLAEAAPLFARALAIREEMPGPDHRQLAPDRSPPANGLAVRWADLAPYVAFRGEGER